MSKQELSDDLPYDMNTLKAYVRGELPEPLASEVHAFARDHEGCAAIIEGLRYFQHQAAEPEQGLEAFLQRSRQRQLDLIKQPPGRSPSIRPLWLGLSVAAAVALLLAVFLVLRPFSRPPHPQQLASQHLETPFAFPLHVRGNLWTEQSLQAYEEGAYATVIERLQALPTQNEQQQFMLGLAHAYRRQYQQALPYLQAVMEMGNVQSGFAEQARWYALQVHVKLGNAPQVEQLLEELLADPAHFKHAEAQELQVSRLVHAIP